MYVSHQDLVEMLEKAEARHQSLQKRRAAKMRLSPHDTLAAEVWARRLDYQLGRITVLSDLVERGATEEED